MPLCAAREVGSFMSFEFWHSFRNFDGDTRALDQAWSVGIGYSLTERIVAVGSVALRLIYVGFAYYAFLHVGFDVYDHAGLRRQQCFQLKDQQSTHIKHSKVSGNIHMHTKKT